VAKYGITSINKSGNEKEDMPLNKLMNGGNAGQQPEGKIFVDGQTGQTLKSSDLKTYGALI
jgi:hypothetical protein